MLLAIQMPAWLVDFWTIYGDMITPILVTILCSLLTYIAIKIKSDAKINSAKTDLQIQALKDVANREDNKPQLEDQSKQINELSKTIAYMADMINLAFQNSNLDPEIKNNLASLSNKIKYGTEEDLVKELENNNALLQEQIEALKEEIANNTVHTVETETKQRIRR